MQRLAAAIVCAVTAAAGVLTAQDATLEYRVKAAYLLNFARFVEWPAGAFAGAPFTICVARTSPFGTALESTIQGETVGGRPLAARVVGPTEVSGCMVLFISGSVPPEPFLRAVGGAPVLTVGESSGFLQQGGVISFLLEEGRVRFAINPAAAARRGLVISSRLLQLARRTGEAGE